MKPDVFFDIKNNKLQFQCPKCNAMSEFEPSADPSILNKVTVRCPVCMEVYCDCNLLKYTDIDYNVVDQNQAYKECWESLQRGKSNAVDHPAHYQSETGLEVIDVMEAFTFDLKGAEAIGTSNVIKYICRWKKKNGLEDLKKARVYLNRLIDHVEKLEKLEKENE